MGKRRNLRNPTCLSRFQQISATVFPELGRQTIEVAPGLDSDDDDEEDDIPDGGIQPGLQTPSMFVEKLSIPQIHYLISYQISDD